MSAHCGTKIKHASRDEALEHVKGLVYMNHLHGEDERSAGLAPYPCDECGQWHVGHHPTAPLVWHYTVGVYLDRIIESGCLKPAAPRAMPRRLGRQLSGAKRLEMAAALEEPAPLLWFSRNPEWEYSVMKVKPEGPRHWSYGRATQEIVGLGLLRFGIPASLAKLRWPDYLALNPTPSIIKAALAACGYPEQWLATDEFVKLEWVRTIELYYRAAWVDIRKAPSTFFDDFERYLEERPAAYAAAWRTLGEKLQASALSADAPQEQLLTLAGLSEAEQVLLRDMIERRHQHKSIALQKVGA
jgi:hypothetical protein